MSHAHAWQLMPDFEKLNAVFGSLDNVFELKGEIVTQDKLSEVIRVEVGGRRFYVKRYHRAGKGLKQFLGRSRIKSEWMNLLLFTKLGIPTAPVVAYGEYRALGIFKRGALVTQEIAHTQDLAELARNNDARLGRSDWVKAISQQTADALRQMHQRQFVHNDYKWRNLLVDDEDRVYLIDCPLGAFWPKPIFLRRRFKDFKALDRVAKYKLRATQRLRFYLQYVQKTRLEPKDKRFLRQLLGKTERRISSFAPERASRQA
ncbi:MAG: protein kinase [Methylophaga sp.]|nr:protein kinase [Methylophaga sp.]